MKIAIRFKNHPFYSAGGAERQMKLISQNLNRKNIDFYFITLKVKQNQKNFETINGIKIYNIADKPISPPKNLFDKLLNLIYSYDIKLFLKFFHILKFDIFHFREASKLTGFWAFFAKFIKRKKFVFTAASISHCIRGFKDLSKFHYKLYEFGLKSADIVTVLSKQMQDELYKNYGIKSVVIRSGHPIPKKPFKKEYPPIIMWISSLKEVKRPEIFLEIAKNLRDLNVAFLLIGPGNYMKKEIIKFSMKQKNFSFINGVPTGNDNYYYEKASLVVNTSIYEGFPNTFIQAWLYEVPVISLNVDPDNVISNNKLGFHAKGNIDQLIKKIKELINEPNKLKKMAKRSRNYAIENHDIIKTAKKYYKIYTWLSKK